MWFGGRGVGAGTEEYGETGPAAAYSLHARCLVAGTAVFGY